MFIKSASTEKPSIIDKATSPTTVYVRKDIVEVEEAEDNPKHYEYLENAIPVEEWNLYESLVRQDVSNLEDAICELAEIIGG